MFVYRYVLILYESKIYLSFYLLFLEKKKQLNMEPLPLS